MFNSMRKPRGFNHQYIYVDERKEKLAKMEENAKRDLGMLPEKEFNPEDIRGKFIEGTTHLKRRKASGRKPVSFGSSALFRGASSTTEGSACVRAAPPAGPSASRPPAGQFSAGNLSTTAGAAQPIQSANTPPSIPNGHGLKRHERVFISAPFGLWTRAGPRSCGARRFWKSTSPGPAGSTPPGIPRPPPDHPPGIRGRSRWRTAACPSG